MTIEADRRFLHTLRVLYVEDDDDARTQLALFLKKRVGDVQLARDGVEGLAEFERARPDLVVTDIQMPGLDGLAMAEEIRERDRKIPIIITTAFEDTRYLMRAIEVGIDRYVVKPIDTERLLSALMSCARQLRAEEALKAARARELDVAHTRHLEAVGLLAGGMAHDFNNLFQSTILALNELEEMLPRTGEAREMLDVALTSVMRAKSLGEQLTVLAKGGVISRKPTALEPLLRSSLTTALRGGTVELGLRVDPTLPLIPLDPVLIGQLFTQLTTNAVEAMPQGGKLEVIGTRVPTDGRMLVPGEYVEISFRDSGRGIPDELLPHIFDAYVTTKPAGGRGLGLGLALSRAIVLKHLGTVTAESSGQGATFRVFLPIDPPRA